MPKRAFPFDSYSPRQAKIHVNNFHVEKETYMQKIYKKTTDILMKASAKIYGTQIDENNCPKEQKSALKCQGCGRGKCNDACEFCSKKICSICSRNCDDCGGTFCGVCSIINYDERDERIFCLGCQN